MSCSVVLKEPAWAPPVPIFVKPELDPSLPAGVQESTGPLQAGEPTQGHPPCSDA